MLLSKALLLHPNVMNIMTETMINYKFERQIFPQKHLTQLKEKHYTEKDGEVKFGVYNSIKETEKKHNFNRGAIVLHVANSIMPENDQEEAREQNKILKKEGKNYI